MPRVALAAAAAAALARPAVAADVVSTFTGGGTTTAPASGPWSAATSWSPAGVPASGPATELDFGGSAAAGYVSTDDLGPFMLNAVRLASTSAGTDTVAAADGTDTLAFVANATVAPTLVQAGGGAFNVSLGLLLPATATTTISGAGTGGVTFAGSLAGAGPLLVSAAAPVTFAGPTTAVGYLNVSTGNVTFAGTGSVTAGGLSVGGTTGRGLLRVATAGTVSLTSADVGGVTGVASSAAVGVVTQTAGTVLAGGPAGATQSYLSIGAGIVASGGSAGYGSYTLAGGTLAAGANTTVRVAYTGTGLFTQTGGTLDLSAGTGLTLGGYAAGGNAAVVLTGGTVLGPSTGAISLYGNLSLGTLAGGSATIVLRAPGSGILFSAGQLNLNSGTVLVQSGGIVPQNNTANAIKFNGATVRAGADNQVLVGGGYSGGVIVLPGGAIFDTQGYTATVASPLIPETGNGFYPAGGTVAVPAGAGGAGYLAAPAVSLFNPGISAVATVANGAVTGFTLTSPGATLTVGQKLTFAFSGGGPTTPAPAFTYTLTAADVAPNNTGGLTKLGTGTLLLTAQNTYAGPTNVSGGTVQLDMAASTAGGALGPGPVNLAAGAGLNVNYTIPITVPNAIAGAGGLRQIGPAATTLTGNSTYAGPTTVADGRLVLGSTGGLGNTAVAVAGGASFSAQPGAAMVTIGTGGAALTLGPGAAFDMTDGQAGTVNLVGGPAALTLGGPTGTPATLAFEAGTPGSSDRLAVAGGVSVAATGATVAVVPIAGFAAGDYTVATATGGGLGTAGLSLGNTEAFSAGTVYGLSLSHSTATTEVVTATAVTGRLAAAVWSGVVSNVWTDVAAGGVTNFQTDATTGTGTAGLLPDPTTNVVFSVAAGGRNLNTVLGGDVTVNSLTFNASSAGPVTVGGPNRLTIDAFAVNGNAAGTGLALAAGAPAVTISAPTFLNSSQSWTNYSANPLVVAGIVGGAAGLTLDGGGTVVLAGPNSFAGGLTVGGGGTVDVNHPSALGGGIFTVASAVTIDNTSGSPVAVSTNNPIVLGGPVTFTGTGDLNLGAGPVTFAGTGTGTGAVTVNAGTLTLGGPVQANGSGNGITFAGAGTLTLAGTLSGRFQLTQSGPGTVNLTGAGSVIAFNLFLNGGTTNITGAGGIAGQLLQVGGATGRAVLDVDTTGTIAFEGPDIGGASYTNTTSVAAAGAVVQNAGTVAYSSATAGVYLSLGAGTSPTNAGYGSYTGQSHLGQERVE